MLLAAQSATQGRNDEELPASATAADLGHNADLASSSALPPMPPATSPVLLNAITKGRDLALDELWIAEALGAHNALRARHGCPPLEWSLDCAAMARFCAELCEDTGEIHHCHHEKYGMGQNIFQGSSKIHSAVDAVQSWYNELFDPGYVPGRSNHRHIGTSNFTQVAWCATTHVGMNVDPYGAGIIVANYYPAGNLDGYYIANVPPLGTPMRPRLRPCKLCVRELTQDVENILNACPNESIVCRVRDHLRDGQEMEVEFKPPPKGHLKVKLPATNATLSFSW